MWYSVISYFHILAILVMFSSLVMELTVLKKEMNRKEADILVKADLFFGIFAGLTAVFGLLRMFYYGKGADYYLMNPLFIIKLSAFILVGLLSIYPTVTFLKIRKNTEGKIFIKPYKKIKLIILSELIMLLILPLLAVLVANGFGV